MNCKLKALQWSYIITRYQYTWFAWEKKLFQWICVTMDTAFISLYNLRCRHNQRLTICVVAQWVACLNRNRWLPVNREFESHQRLNIAYSHTCSHFHTRIWLNVFKKVKLTIDWVWTDNKQSRRKKDINNMKMENKP